jgi:hypothetical protein
MTARICSHKKENTMSIETDLKRIADALEMIAGKAYPLNTETGQPTAAPDVNVGRPELTAHPGTDAPKPPKAAKKTAVAAQIAPGTTAPTMDDLMDVLRELVTSKGVPAAREVLQKFGAGKISEVKAENYQVVFDALKTAKG